MNSFAQFGLGLGKGNTPFAKIQKASIGTNADLASNSPKKLTTVYSVKQYVDNGNASLVLDIDNNYSSYKTILEASASHTAGKVAGTYALSFGNVAAVSGTGTLYPLQTIYLAAADYPASILTGLQTRLRIRAQLFTNNVAPTGNYTFGLYPFTRPASSGGAGECTYTIGTVVGGSNGAAFTAPAADGLLADVGSDFLLPADGHYLLAFVTTQTVAANAHVHMVAKLQMHNA